MMDAEGKVIARTGYKAGGPEKYVAQLAEFVKVYNDVLQMKPQLEKAQGLDRAKLLDQLIDAYAKLNNEIEEVPGWCDEIITLDADNAAGLKIKYEVRNMLAEAGKLNTSRKFDEAQTVLEKIVALPGIAVRRNKTPILPRAKVSS